eukprot:GHVS01071606.1.p1 GENE.GHVS01071606.1~~GHVS01071606.1.p1  ORF type:complete len:335 (+),score=69.66 GHVS01071606.1:194-1198(+)
MVSTRLREAPVMVPWEEALRTASCVLYISVFCSLYIYVCLFKLLWLDVNIAEVLRGPAEERRRRRVWRRLRRLRAIPPTADTAGNDDEGKKRGCVWRREQMEGGSEDETSSTYGRHRGHNTKPSFCRQLEQPDGLEQPGGATNSRRGGAPSLRCQNSSKGNKKDGHTRATTGSSSCAANGNGSRNSSEMVVARRQEGGGRGSDRELRRQTTETSPGSTETSPRSSSEADSSVSSDAGRGHRRRQQPEPNGRRRRRRPSVQRRRVREVRGQVEISLFGWRVSLFELSPDPFAWLLPPCVLVGLSLAIMGWLHFFGSIAKLTNQSEEEDELWVVGR